MILVAESGSTKTQWCAISAGEVLFLKNTPGINPILLSVEEIESIIRPVSSSVKIGFIDSVYFFGAGCSSISSKEKVGKAIFSIFECPEIIVDSDLIAACLALSGNKPGIVCLLGTGSNSCLWNGEAIETKAPSLGYILGDEGGGVSIGKKLVSDFLMKRMPNDIWMAFSEKFDVSVEKVIERVYQSTMPNRYLASFAPFAEQHIDSDYCFSLVCNQFEIFIQDNVLKYKAYKKLETYFCGSIAFAHKQQLLTICNKYSVKVGEIVKEPLKGLADFLKTRI
jgi:glucosamine kinase